MHSAILVNIMVLFRLIKFVRLFFTLYCCVLSFMVNKDYPYHSTFDIRIRLEMHVRYLYISSTLPDKPTQKGDAENARHELAGHENAAPCCRGGKCET